MNVILIIIDHNNIFFLWKIMYNLWKDYDGNDKGATYENLGKSRKS